MAAAITFSKRQLKKLEETASCIEQQEICEYLKEAIRCLGANANRAAIVLVWSAVINQLRQTIGQIGFARFKEMAMELARANKLRLNPDQTMKLQAMKLKEDWEGVILKDQDFIEVCAKMGILNAHEKNELQGFAELRNKCAHPTSVQIRSGQVMTLLEVALARLLPTIDGGWSLNAAYFESFLIIPIDQLDIPWVISLMGLVPQSQHLPFVSRLLSLYNDPYGYGGSALGAITPPEVAANIRTVVPVLWELLAKHLNPTDKAKANAKLANLLIGRTTSRDVWRRTFVFWDQWKDTSMNSRRVITGWLIAEFTTLIKEVESNEVSPPLERVELDHLDMMAQSADKNIQERCRELLVKARAVQCTAE